MIIESAFKPAWWLRNAHAQTVFGTLTRNIKAPVTRVERLELCDGDFIELAWAAKGLNNDAPLVFLLHGLGGSIHSQYIAGLMTQFNQNGWRALLMHFRGAGNEPNRLHRAYHSGDTGDLNTLLQEFQQREPYSKKAVVGISLGGNVLLKWLGEIKQQSLISAAAAVSVPFQLRLIADRINQGFSRIYQEYLLRRLRETFAKKWERYASPLPLTSRDLNNFRCFWTFDENITAPLHGFANVHDYYRQASCRQYLHQIATSTLIIHALDDPFMSTKVVPDASELSAEITLELSKKGGHVGFISGQIPGKPVYWLDERIPAYLRNFLD